MSPLTFSLIFAVTATLVVGGYWLWRYLRHKRLVRDFNMSLLAVRLPSGETQTGESTPTERKDPLSEVASTAQLLSALATSNSSFVLEVAVHNVGEEIIFYIAVPKKIVEFTMRQIEGLWSGAQIDLASDDYTIFNPQGAIAVASLRLKNHYALPIRTYVEAQLDTFATVLSNFSKMNTIGEGLALQLIVAPAPKSAKKVILDYIRKIRQGGKASDIIGGKSILDIIASGSQRNKDDEKDKIKVVDEEAAKTLEQKISKPLFSVNVRLVASAPTPHRMSELLDGLAGSFTQFAAPLRNELKVVSLGNSKSVLFGFIFREFNAGDAMILNADEVTSLFHFPISTTDIPRVKSVRSKEAVAPTNLPKVGTLIGESVFRGERRPVYITDEDRRRHVYVIGQTGTGKSVLLKNMVMADIRAGKGAAIIDPHGDLVDDILAAMPKERYKDVIVFDPSDRMYPLGLNMLEYDARYPEQKTFIVNEMQSIFNKLFSQETMGPMFEQYMRNALLLLMEDAANEPATLMEVPRIFTDVEYRKKKLERVTNPIVLDFWEKEAVKVGGEASLANMTPYITSKFNNFIANDYVRPIIGQTKSAFNFRQIMDDGKILLVNLSKGRIGDINAGLLGMVIVGKLLMAALSRVDIAQENRRDFNLYIDEFQNFSTDSISTILSEARKYRLNLVVAHQFIAQLEEKIRDSVFGNVGSMVIFRVGADDVEFLEKQFVPVFSKNDLMNIDNFNAYVKLLISGQTAKPFNIRTIKPPVGDAAVRDNLKELSRTAYGAERYAVEQDIMKRLRE